jgi:hypothetical protein
MRRFLTAFALVLLAFAAAHFGVPRAAAQADAPPNTVIDVNALITSPPAIYTLYGDVTVRGSANVANMTGYFLEFRPLNSDFSRNESAPWTPAIPRQAVAVLDNILGVWDTTIAEDGVYELRLSVPISGGSVVTYTVSPLRVENTPPAFPITQNDPRFGVSNVVPTALPDGGLVATQIPAVTQAPAVTAPLASPNVSSINVRTGDSTAYPVVTTLLQGQTAEVIGISNTGSGWYQVRTANGRVGFVSDTVVTITGDVANLPRVQPPPVPATPTPTPVPATNTPVAAANLVAGIVVLNPAPTCAQPFTVGFDVANLGSLAAPGGSISVTDSRAADGSVQVTTSAPFPPIAPGVTVRVNIPLTISTWYNEVHRITLVIDPGNVIAENNKGDNQRVVEYTLARGGCP